MFSPKHVVCTRCGHHGPAKTVVPGSFVLELFLWLCWILPGLFYSIWRAGNKRPGCTACGSTDVIPEATAAAQAVIREQATAHRDEMDCPWCAERVLRNARVCKHCGRELAATNAMATQ